MSADDGSENKVESFKTRQESMSVTNMSMRNSTDQLTSVGMVLNNGDGCMK